MPKLNTTVKSVRIDNDKLEELERRLGSQSINSWLNDQIEAFLSGKPEKTEGKTVAYVEIEEMVTFCGLTMDRFWEDIADKLTSGVLMFEDGGTRVELPKWAEDFRDACHDMCIPVEKAVENAIKAMKK